MKCLLLAAALACFSLLPSRAGELKQEPPKSLKSYTIPEESFHYVNDVEEATRRWNTTQEGLTVDVVSIQGNKPPKVLTPIVKGAALKKMQKQDAEKAFLLDISVTAEQDRLIREALEKKTPLLVGYYHYRW